MTKSSREKGGLLFGAGLAEIDPDVYHVIRLEEERQVRKIILIASESIAPSPVRAALSSVFTHLYAEGYPASRMIHDDRMKLTDYEEQMAYQRRYADLRYYKGTEYADFVEALAIRRVRALFANERVAEHQIWANVQPLSGAAANNAVYEAFLEPGDPVMGLALTHGGHLTHGSPVNRSGRRYRIIPYHVSPSTGRLDYDEMLAMAREHKPRMIIGGFSAYPWDIDWARMRACADAAGNGCILMADISHTAGLVAAKAIGSPVGIADVITFTTHKTMCGPRGAVILTTSPERARRIDAAVFPGEQGGPHVNNIAAEAVAFGIAATGEFKRLMRLVKENSAAMAKAFEELGLKIVYGGTETHLFLIDLKSVPSKGSEPLTGEIASRILDLCNVTVNKNTIPGDANAAHPGAIRIGTTFATQRGLTPAHAPRLAKIIYDVLCGIRTFTYGESSGHVGRGKVEYALMERTRAEVAKLVAELDAHVEVEPLGYPYYPVADERFAAAGGIVTIEVAGARAESFLQGVSTANVAAMEPGDAIDANVLDKDGKPIAAVRIRREKPDELGRDLFTIGVAEESAGKLSGWLRALSDGYVIFDDDDVYCKVRGPVIVRAAAKSAGHAIAPKPQEARIDLTKPFFIGQKKLKGSFTKGDKAEFADIAANVINPPADAPLKRSCLYEEHLKLTKKSFIVPFAGWEMPVWYSSISEEHKAVREAAGLFDVSHMGVLEVSGRHATAFLDAVTTNCVEMARVGQSLYSYYLDPDGQAIDDTLIYRRAADRYMLVVNASNNDKVWAWLNAVNDRRVTIDRFNPACVAPGPVALRDLRAKSTGGDRRIDMAIQGPASLAILQSVAADDRVRLALAQIRKTDFIETTLGGVDMIVSRTGYTGEEVGYELYLHPDRAPRVWNMLLEAGRPHGLVPAGLGARDSTRTEAGLPLYGHELAGRWGIVPTGAGYGPFVKFHKPFFIGRSAVIEHEKGRTRQVIRFQVLAKGVRALTPGDPVVSRRGEFIGNVTSSALVDGYQIGMAYVDRKYVKRETPIAIYPMGHDGRGGGGEVPIGELKPGDKVTLPQEAVVLSRFPKRKPKTRKGTLV